MESSVAEPQELNTGSSGGSAVSLLGTHMKELQTGAQTKYVYTNAHGSTLHDGPKVETTSTSISG